MRDIKFRSWNVVDKTMYNSIYNCKDSFEMQLKHPQIYKIMQYTGLKDKNGIEIYEGDIVKFLDDEIYYSECGTEYDEFENIGQVIYDEEMLAFDITNRNIDRESVWETTLEVIGNIYENPELLEKVKMYL